MDRKRLRLAVAALLLAFSFPCWAKTPWEILGIPPDSGPDDIRHAYKKLASQNHPDRTQGDKAKTQTFLQVCEAYEQLTENLDYWRANSNGSGPSSSGKSKPQSTGKPENPFPWNQGKVTPNADVDEWLEVLQASYRQSTAQKRSGSTDASPIADAIRSAFSRVGGEVNVTGRYGDVLSSLGQDMNLLEAIRLFLRRNLADYLEAKPSAKELNEIGRAAFNAAFGRSSTYDPAWLRFSKTMAWLMKESQQIAQTEEEFADAARYQFSHEPSYGTSLDDPNRKEVLTRSASVLWEQSALYSRKFNKPREEMLVRILETLPPDYQSSNGFIASTIMNMADGDFLEGFKRPDITDHISPEGKVRIAILIRDLSKRQQALSRPGYRLAGLSERATEFLKAMLSKHPDLNRDYRPRAFGLTGQVTAFICARFFKKVKALPPTSVQAELPLLPPPSQ